MLKLPHVLCCTELLVGAVKVGELYGSCYESLILSASLCQYQPSLGYGILELV